MPYHTFETPILVYTIEYRDLKPYVYAYHAYAEDEANYYCAAGVSFAKTADKTTSDPTEAATLWLAGALMVAHEALDRLRRNYVAAEVDGSYLDGEALEFPQHVDLDYGAIEHLFRHLLCAFNDIEDRRGSYLATWREWVPGKHPHRR